MLPVHREMIQEGWIRVEPRDFGDGVIEQRTIPLRDPDLQHFDEQDIAFVDQAVAYYWHLTGMETSDDSHGPAWLTRADRDPMPYETALLSDRRPGRAQMERLERLIYDRSLQTG
jgi:hypothetical protein